MTPTNDDIADVLDGAFDWFLVHGRCTTFDDADGRGCVHRALGVVSLDAVGIDHPEFETTWNDLRRGAVDALMANIGRPIAGWNDTATDDEVFDALKSTAKELRDTA